MKTIIEAGHFYSVPGPSYASVKGWEIGKGLTAGTPDSELALFIDDYHDEQLYLEPGDSFLGGEEGAVAATVMIGEADHIFSEADIAKSAVATLSELLEDGLVKLKKGIVTVGGVRLGTLADGTLESFEPTCTFLDYLQLLKKAQLGSHQITVLPEIYTKQQSQLAVVLGKLTVPMLISYKTIFHNLAQDSDENYQEMVV